MPRPAPFVPPVRPSAPIAPYTTPSPQDQNALIYLASLPDDLPDAPTEVRRLLDQGALLNAVDQTGRTALHVAAWKNRPALVHALLDAGAMATARDQDGADALAELISNLLSTPPAEGLIARLVAAGANPNGYAWDGWTRYAKENLGEDLPLGDGQWLHDLANGQPLPLERVPEADEATRAMLQTTMTRVLSSAFKVARIQRMTPLAHALRLDRCSETVVEELLAVGADPLLPVGFGATATLFHLMTDHTPVGLIDRLLDLGVPADTPDGHGNTPLQSWSERGESMAAHVQRLTLRLEQRQLHQVAQEARPGLDSTRGRPRL